MKGAKAGYERFEKAQAPLERSQGDSKEEKSSECFKTSQAAQNWKTSLRQIERPAGFALPTPCLCLAVGSSHSSGQRAGWGAAILAMIDLLPKIPCAFLSETSMLFRKRSSVHSADISGCGWPAPDTDIFLLASRVLASASKTNSLVCRFCRPQNNSFKLLRKPSDHIHMSLLRLRKVTTAIRRLLPTMQGCRIKPVL